MILQDRALLKALNLGEIRVEPEVANALQPISIELHLGDSFARFRNRDDPSVPGMAIPRRLGQISERDYERIQNYPYGSTVVVPSLGFLLGVTVERISLDEQHAGLLMGCSSIGRSGLLIQNAGLIDPGFVGTLTLELFNMAPFPIALEVGERIGQLVIVRTQGAVDIAYGDPRLGSRYQGQHDAEPPRRARAVSTRTRREQVS